MAQQLYNAIRSAEWTKDGTGREKAVAPGGEVARQPFPMGGFIYDGYRDGACVYTGSSCLGAFAAVMGVPKRAEGR